MKRHTTLSVDDELIQEVKEKGSNVSEILEEALKAHLGKEEVEITNSENCQQCGREMRMATRKDLYGLTWLYPEEMWICPNCLKTRENVLAFSSA